LVFGGFPVGSPVLLRHLTAPDGVQLACDVQGEGPPLVMIHGAGSARWSFDLVRPHLEDRFTVWALDRRGRGDSGDGDRYALELEFADVAAAVREAGPGALLFGHSYGALLSTAAAGRLDGIPRLVSYEAPMGGVLADEAWIERFEARLEADERDAAVRDFMHDVGGYSQEEIDAMRGTPAWQGRLEAAPTVPRELRAERALSFDELRLGELELPSLLLVGSESPDWARRSTDAFAAALPHGEVHTLEGQGHGAAVGAPELLAEEILGFVP
jgi:pimeloyl-ACP methyl ester carboxylesterase